VIAFVGQVLGEVITLLRESLGGSTGVTPSLQRRVPLIGLGADKTVENTQSRSRSGHWVERPHRARLPHGHLMALGRTVAVLSALSFIISASGAALSGRIELYPGAEVAISVIPPMPTA